MGINPNTFGPGVWNTLMMFAWQYPNDPTKEQQINMLQWMRLTMMHLPCPQCSTHAKAYVEKHEPDVSCKEKLINYIVQFHNFVNISLKKPTFTTMEAKAAFISKLSEDFKDLPRAQIVAKENFEKIQDLQKQLTKYQQSNDPNSDYYYYSTIGLGIALGVLLLLFIIVLIASKRRQNRLTNELYQAKNKYSMST